MLHSIMTAKIHTMQRASKLCCATSGSVDAPVVFAMRVEDRAGVAGTGDRKCATLLFYRPKVATALMVW